MIVILWGFEICDAKVVVSKPTTSEMKCSVFLHRSLGNLPAQRKRHPGSVSYCNDDKCWNTLNYQTKDKGNKDRRGKNLLSLLVASSVLFMLHSASSLCKATQQVTREQEINKMQIWVEVAAGTGSSQKKLRPLRRATAVGGNTASVAKPNFPIGSTDLFKRSTQSLSRWNMFSRKNLWRAGSE